MAASLPTPARDGSPPVRVTGPRPGMATGPPMLPGPRGAWGARLLRRAHAVARPGLPSSPCGDPPALPDARPSRRRWPRRSHAVASRCCSSMRTPTAAAWRRPWGCSTRRPGSRRLPRGRPGLLDLPALSRIAPTVVPGLRVLTGLPKAERWPEVRAAALERVLELSRSLVQVVVVDCGFCLEDDEELSYDTVAPRRNEATLTSLAASDPVVAVSGADPWRSSASSGACRSSAPSRQVSRCPSSTGSAAAPSGPGRSRASPTRCCASPD